MTPRGIRRWLRLFPADPERDVDDELDFHIEQRIAEYEREGLTPEQARIRAHARFGDRISARNATLSEDTRRMRAEHRVFFFRDIGQDLRFAFRTLRRQRLPAALAALCVALGIGSTTAVLSVGDALLLRPLPFPNGERLVSIGTENPGRPLSASDVNSFENYADWRARNRSFVDVAAQANATVTLGTTDPIRGGAALASASLWKVLGARPERGRTFSEAEDAPGGPRVVMVSRGFAERNWGNVDAFSGKQLTINGRVHDVIGVVATSARFPEGADLWLPIARAPDESRRGSRSYSVIAQLKPGVTIDAAQLDMNTVVADVARQHPESNAKRRVALAPLRERYVGAARDGFRIAAGAALLVLLIACANVACLQLARGSARAREISVRTALGASRMRLMRQLLTENVMLALAGGAAGVGLGVWGSTYVGRAVAENAPPWMTFRLNVTVLVITTIICVAAGILFGMAPALGLTRGNHWTRHGTDATRARHRRIGTDARACVYGDAGGGKFCALVARGYRLRCNKSSDVSPGTHG